MYIEVRLNSANKQDYKLHTTVYHPEVKILTTVRIVTLKLTDATQFSKSSVSIPEFNMICCTQIANLSIVLTKIHNTNKFETVDTRLRLPVHILNHFKRKMIYPTVAELNLLLGRHQIPLTKLHGNVKQLEGRINIMILVKGYKYAAIIIAFGLVCHI